MSKQSEERIAILEAKQTELSDLLGNAERLRHQDQLTIQKLKERIIQVLIEDQLMVQKLQKMHYIGTG